MNSYPRIRYPEDITMTPYVIIQKLHGLSCLIRECPYDNKNKTYSFPKEIRTSEKWVIREVFYALKPDTLPVPSGMRPLCILETFSTPRRTVTVQIDYNPVGFRSDVFVTCTRFIAWSLPIINTTPLYFYKKGRGVYITFEEDPASDTGYVEISPIFVIKHENAITGLSFKPQVILFSCLYGRCIPTLPLSVDEYTNQTEKLEKLSISQCLNKCSSTVNPIDIASTLDVVGGESRESREIITANLQPFSSRKLILIALLILLGIVIIL